jgi:hypothetical protein
MKKMLQAAAVAAAVLAVPAMSLAAQTKTAGAPPAKSTTHKTETAATHSAKGVVKSMDATSLVVTEKGKDVSYVLDASTKKEGDPAVGSNVTVMYKTEGTQHVATDVKAAAAKPAHSSTKPAKK